MDPPSVNFTSAMIKRKIGLKAINASAADVISKPRFARPPIGNDNRASSVVMNGDPAERVADFIERSPFMFCDVGCLSGASCVAINNKSVFGI